MAKMKISSNWLVFTIFITVIVLMILVKVLFL